MAKATNTCSTKFGDGDGKSRNITSNFSNPTICKFDKDAKIIRWLSLLAMSKRF